VLKLFLKTHGPERSVVLARAPGRVNLMGRHVDHRGGYVNVMAISREVVMAAAPRDDDVVTLTNVDQRDFPDRSFRIGELLRSADWMGWMDYVNSSTVRQVLEAYRGDWSNYAKAAVTRLQHACSDHRLAGMDCAVAGNIPMGAGLSSSSAVVVASAECAVLLNGLDLTPQQFVDLCGEGEWFVGSRGGSADHAAIRSGERGRVARVGFFPFRIEKTFPFPKDLSLVIANSHVRASKSAGARDTFNQRVATYNLAEVMLRNRVAICRSVEHLRDVSPAGLDVSPAEIYRALKRLPQQITRKAALRMLPEHKERIEELFETHKYVGPYRLRDVAMYGIAECQRSDRFAEELAARRLEEVTRLMRISHDGDRVVHYRGGQAVPYAPSYSDARLERLGRDAASEDPVRQAKAALWAQPGRYACSMPQIDYIVDLAAAQQGVISAQLAGAGLGGCAMILVRSEFLEGVLKALRRNYYRPHRLSFDAHVCQPVAGSGVIRV
jgi:N-acetylgalactosamine kinase